MSGVSKFREVQLQDIVQDPNKYGAPTYEQFCKNPDAWRLRKDQVFISADRGSDMFKDVVKHTYSIGGYKTTRLEEISKICLNEGIDESTLQMKITHQTGIGGGREMFIEFRKKPA